MRLDGYIRVSRVGGREGEGYISPDVQRDAIQSYAKELGGKIAAWHDDQDYSGGSVERPGFQAALERLRASDSDGLVVMRIDRFARSVADGASIVREIIEADQVFASCHERIDPRTPEGTYMLNSFLNNAELFLNQSKASWWTSKSRAVARGVHIGPTPVGYQRAKSQPLSPHPVYGPAMTDLFRRAASGEGGDTALARWFTDRAPGENRRAWMASEVRRWLTSRVYLGEVRYGELINTEAHEPLTDPETWQRCQREPGVQRKARSRFLLSGLVRCAACRYSMGGFSRGGGGDTPVYRCIGGSRGCPEPSLIVAKRIEPYVIGIAKAHLEGLRLEASADVDLKIDREWHEAVEEQRAFASDLEARRLLGDQGWREALSARVADVDAKRERRERAFTDHRLAGMTRSVDDLSHEELRDFLAGMIRVIFVRRRPRGAEVDDRVLVLGADAPMPDVPGPHRSGPFEPYGW